MQWASYGVRGHSGVLSGTEVGIGDCQSAGTGDCQASGFNSSLTDRTAEEEGVMEVGADVEDMLEMMTYERREGCHFMAGSTLLLIISWLCPCFVVQTPLSTVEHGHLLQFPRNCHLWGILST